MKKSILIASLAALAFVAGCASSKDTSGDGNMGVVGESKKGGCCQQQKSECTDKPAEGSMGVVSEKKSCEGKSDCSTAGPATCPFAGKGDKQN